MFRLFNVNHPEKLIKLAKECKGEVKVEFNKKTVVNMKDAGAEKKAKEMLKEGMRNIVVVLDNVSDLRAYTQQMLLA